jgi:hypothetical protein
VEVTEGRQSRRHVDQVHFPSVLSAEYVLREKSEKSVVSKRLSISIRWIS